MVLITYRVYCCYGPASISSHWQPLVGTAAWLLLLLLLLWLPGLLLLLLLLLRLAASDFQALQAASNEHRVEPADRQHHAAVGSGSVLLPAG
jgi:hypothetical protein